MSISLHVVSLLRGSSAGNLEATSILTEGAFSESACAALMALEDGDALAVAGTLKPGAWVDRDGKARPNVDLVAAQVMTVYGLKKKRDDAHSGERHQAPRQHPPGDDFRPDDAWLNGGQS